MKRNRSRKRYIPKGAEIYSDGSWFFKFKDPKSVYRADGTLLGFPTGFGEMVCNAE